MLPLDSSFWWTLRKRTPQGTALEPHRFHGQSTNSESFHQPETNWTKLFPWNFTKHLSLFSPWTFSSFTHSKQRRGKSSLFFFRFIAVQYWSSSKSLVQQAPQTWIPPKKNDSKLHLQVGAILGGAVLLCGIWYLYLGFSILFLGGVGP